MKTHDNIHALAETFLQQYLAQTGSKPEPVQLASVHGTARQVVKSHAAAANEFIKEFEMTRQKRAETERYEISPPDKLILARRNARATTYFYGWRRSTPVFTHSRHLAQVIDLQDADKLQESLRQTGIETFVIPAPEIRRGSL